MNNLADHIPIVPDSHNVERARIKAVPKKDFVPGLVNGNLDDLMELYLSWVKSPVVYGVSREIITSYQSPQGYTECFTAIDTIFRKGAKRGNAEYIEVIKERISDYNSKLPDVQFFNPKDRKIQKTKMLYVVLTTDPSKFENRYHAWLDIGNRVNKFRSNIKRFYGCSVHISRSWECFYQKAEGYPHVNLVIYLKDKWVDCFPQIRKSDKKRVWRTPDKSKLAQYWDSGFIDVYAISRVAGLNEDYVDGLNNDDPIRDNSVLSVQHMTKYMTKNMTSKTADKKTILLNALLWVMRKRSFSLSNMFFDVGKEASEFIHTLSNSNIWYPGTISITVIYRLLGVYPGCVMKCKDFHAGIPPPFCPYNKHNNGLGECCYSKESNDSPSPKGIFMELLHAGHTNPSNIMGIMITRGVEAIEAEHILNKFVQEGVAFMPRPGEVKLT